MGLGLGILLIVAGAVLTFAVTATVNGVDLSMIGYILMGAGGLTLLLGLIMNQQKSNTSHRQVVDRRDGPPHRYDQ